MRRFLVGLLAAVILAAPDAALANGQPAAPPERPLDLAAMTLTPSDLDALGLPGFGLANQSSMRDAETDAVVQADGNALDAAERLEIYEENGFRARYVGSLLQPRLPLVRRRSGLIDAEVRVTTAVTEFATAEGAAAVFGFNEGPMDDAPGEDVEGSRPFGDQSELTRSTGTEALSGEPLQRLELAARTGNLIAEVVVVDYRAVEPDLPTVERLGEALLDKLATVRANGGAGLSGRAVRLTPAAPWIEEARLRDYYVRREGVAEPTFAQIVAALRDGRSTPVPQVTLRPGTVSPIDTYMYWTPVGEGDPLDLPLYVAWLDRYDSPEQARAALTSLTDDLGPGYVDVVEFTAGEELGDQSREWVYAYEGDPSGPVRGHLVVVRVGSELIRAQVDAPGGVRGEGVRVLAAAQAACLRDATTCAPLPALDVLADLVAPTPT